MRWFVDELRLVWRPMCRWWLHVGIWWLGAATFCFLLRPLFNTWLLPWAANTAHWFSHAEQMGTPGPFGLTYTQWDAVDGMLSTLTYSLCAIAWFLGAEKVINLRMQLVREQALPQKVLHRRGAYLLALASGVLPLTILLLNTLWLWKGAQFQNYLYAGMYNSVPFLQMFCLLIVPLVVLQRSRWIAWYWLLGMYIIIPLVANLYYGCYYFQHRAWIQYQRQPAFLSDIQANAGYAWEFGALVILLAIWLMARGYISMSLPLVLLAAMSSLLVSFERAIPAPHFLLEFEGFYGSKLYPDPLGWTAMDLLRGPQQFLNEEACEVSFNPYYKQTDRRIKLPDYQLKESLYIRQPISVEILMPRKPGALPFLYNTVLSFFLILIVWYWVLPEPSRDELQM